MSLSTSSKNHIRDRLLPVVLCLCFIACSLLFLVHMIIKSQQENVAYLYNAANQTKTSLLKQIEGDLQTIEGLAVSLKDQEIADEEKLLAILKDINDRNAFIRMGYADVEGNTWLVDISGETYTLNIGEMDFFRRAMGGENSISNTFVDPERENSYVNYYGSPMRNRDGEITGVLCAVHSAVVLREIIDSSLLRGAGYSNILDRNGDYVLKSIKTFDGDIIPENKQKIVDIIQNGGTGNLILKDRNDTRQMLAVLPLIDGQWYLVSMVPVNVLRASYIETAFGIMVIIVVACCIFIWMMTRQRIMAAKGQKMLMSLAYRDSLTGLRNFDGFKLEAKNIVKDGEITSYVLWYGDIKKFKFINDILGYREGDRILKLLADYLERVESDESITCRVSADNFAGLCKCRNNEEMDQGIRAVLQAMEKSGIKTKTVMEIPMGAYRLRPGDLNQSIDVLMNYANMAHKKAKDMAGSCCVFYDDGIRNLAIEDSLLEAEAEEALKNGEFKAYMQPKVNIQNGNLLVGAEMLVRWISPEKGMISPGRFIPLFEKSERIVMLDRYMFEKACQWFGDYLSHGGRPVNIAVNVSKVGILRPDFMEYYSAIKNKYHIPDGLLELEFTESVASSDIDIFTELVTKLQELGFICSLDDFGSGYSSLNLLKNLPIDVLKLDILFFQNSRDLRRERIVVSNFINLARELHIKTIAEGVEKRDTVEFLKSTGCDVVQGFVFSKPMPLEEFDILLRELGTDPFPFSEEFH